jgi:glycosyltransferase involved in cell wall biosynthesis
MLALRPGRTCKIGILQPRSTGWAAGPKYIRTIAYCLAAACKRGGAEVAVFSEQDWDENHAARWPSEVHRIIARQTILRGEGRVRQFLGLPERSALYRCARQHGISVVLPCMNPSARPFGLRTIGWIPDFQHVYLPNFFSEEARRYRDHAFRQLAKHAHLVILSSHVALGHFSAFSSKYAYKARVFQFPSTLAFEYSEGDPSETLKRFRIPEKFALIPNQFWRHKNHILVIEALERLRRIGLKVPVIMTGLPADYRDPDNENISRLLQAVAIAGLAEQVKILGMVPESDLNNLMRCAALIIQPSRFEGWSTPVQETKALGRPLICSDIPVHHEQAPNALGFFACDRSDVLADLLADIWNHLNAGPDPQNEKKALAVEREFAEAQSQTLLNICIEAAAT